jgi:hypothetical protein
VSRLLDRLHAVLAAVSRITLIPFLVRVGIFATVLAACLLAHPVQVIVSRYGLLLVAVALLPAIGPRRIWLTLAVVVAVAGWFLSTFPEPIVLWRLFGLAGSLYLAHALCALAAALPYDAVVAPVVVARWVLRALGVVLASAVLGILLLTFAAPDGRTSLWAALAGLTAAVGVAGLLARMAGSRRRDRGRGAR